MNTDPLDIVYNEAVVKQVKQFFSPKSRINSMTKEMSEFHLAGNYCVSAYNLCYLLANIGFN